MSSIILVVQLGSGHIHWSRSLTQCALLEWECWWERSPQGYGLGFFGSICSLNISNLFLNAAFCSFFFFFFNCFQREASQIHSSRGFLLCGSTTHSSYYPPSPLPLLTPHPLPQIPPKHLGLAHSRSWFGFPSRSLSAALVANHTLAKQRAPPSLRAVVNPGKNNKIPQK